MVSVVGLTNAINFMDGLDGLCSGIIIIALTSLYLFSIFVIALAALIVCPLSISPWAAFGSAIRHFVKSYKMKIVIEYLLACLLLISAILILLQD